MSWHTNLYKKLKLVDEDELHRLIEKQIREYNPELKAMVDRKLDMHKVLDQKDLTPEQKLLLLDANKQQFSQYQNKANFNLSSKDQTLPTPLPPPPQPPPIEPSLSAVIEPDENSFPEEEEDTPWPYPDVPTVHKDKIDLLGSLIENSNGTIGRDPSTDELVINGEKIVNSSFHDLVKDLFVRSKQTANLKGQDQLISAISRLVSPGGKWENIRLSSIIPRTSHTKRIKFMRPISKKSFHTFDRKSGHFPLQSGKGVGETKIKYRAPPGQKIKILRLY